MCITLKTARETKRAKNNVKEGRGEREFLSSRCPRAASPKKVKKGTTTRSEGCRPDGTRSPSRCRASCCNAKLKQNYLVPLPSLRYTAWGPSRSGGEGDCRRPGAVASYQGCILTRVKNGCLRPYSAPRRNPGMGVCLCALCAQICANLERGVLFVDARRRVKNLLIYGLDGCISIYVIQR